MIKKETDWSYGGPIVIRKAKPDDGDFVLDLRNRDYVRENSWNTNIIKKDEHEKFWKDNYMFYWVIQTLGDNIPIGFVRVKNNEVSIAVLKEYWNQSYGYFALQAISELFPKGIRAEVKMGNIHSLYFFVKCGYVIDGFILNKNKLGGQGK